MKTFVHIATFGLLATALLLGQDEKKEEPSDNDKLQGTWQMVSGERRGQPMPDPEKYSLIITGETITLMRGGEVGFRGKLKLDPTKKPKIMDMELTEDSRGKKKGQISQGIYMIEGDKLKWCNAAPGVDDRPKEFATNEKTNHMLVVLQQKKK